MKIILLEPVENLGHAGATIEVRTGYARNFLVPQGLALEATSSNVKSLEARVRSRQRRLDGDRTEAEKLAGQISGLVVELKARAGEGKIYGAVTAQAIADAVERQTGLAVDRRKLIMPRTVKDLGEYDITYKPHPEVPIAMKLNVTAE